MLDTRFMSRPEAKRMVLIWLQFAERESREAALIESLQNGNYHKYLTETFTEFADAELANLSKSNQSYAEGLLEGLLIRNSYYQGCRKNEKLYY